MYLKFMFLSFGFLLSSNKYITMGVELISLFSYDT